MLPVKMVIALRRSAPSPTLRPDRLRLTLSVEQLMLTASLFFALTANRAFFAATLKDRSATDPTAWGFGAAMFVLVLGLHLLLMALVAHRHTIKPLLVVLILGTAFATYYMGAFGVYLDPSMLRNVMRTDVKEASELFNPEMLRHVLLHGGLPLLILWRIRLRPPAANARWWRAMALRTGLVLGTLATVAGCLLLVFQPFASLMRNQKEVRYLITPANYLWSIGSVLAAETRGAAKPREAIGLDALPGPSWAARRKPLVVVMVVGETARAANWGLNGGRQTTPELAALRQADPQALVNFSQVTACGTNTETSLPCMFAPVGRRAYDEARIRGQQSLLHVVARAGVAVNWRDNQSGCKGVCEGLPSDIVSAATTPALCSDGRCLDEGLVHDLDQRLKAAQGTQLWVLHMLGNHGPSYFRRHPPAFARFLPECRNDDLRQCTVEQITNSYDNALLYTDHLLAQAITRLKARAGEVDTALLYVSDHGESLGEHNLFLHGIPYAIAPDVQKQVPMVMWTSPGLEAAAGLQSGCLARSLSAQAVKAVAHDHLFHTLLGLLDVRTALHEPAFDLASPCRPPAPRPAP